MTVAKVESSVEALGSRFSRYIAEAHDVWGRGLRGAEAADAVRAAMVQFLNEASENEAWAAGILRDRPPGRELYRDPEFGFIQMGHFHAGGHTTSPHDHGPCWVVYGVYRGEIEIPTFRRDGAADDREARLTQIEAKRLGAGVAYAYLPGQIHATRAQAAEGSVVLRFLSEDLQKVKRSHYTWSQVSGA
jgi:predicted metal-dependent enzyme (double-stranded beta helix superfamily)